MYLVSLFSIYISPAKRDYLRLSFKSLHHSSPIENQKLKNSKKTPRFPIVRKIKEKNCTSSANFTSLLFPLPKKQNKKNPPSKKGGPQQARNNLDIANRYRLSSIHPEEGGDNAPVSFGYRLENSEMGTGPRIRVSREKGLILGIPPRQLERPWPGSR